MYTQHQPHVATLPPWERKLDQVPGQVSNHSPRVRTDEGQGGFEPFDDRFHLSTLCRDRGQCSYPPQQHDQHRPSVPHYNSAPQAGPPPVGPAYGFSQVQRSGSYDTTVGPAPPQNPVSQRVTEAQAFATPRDPLTPPYSNHSSATSSPPLEQSQFHRTSPVSLPGTMSTRERISSRTQSNGPPNSGRDHQRKNSTKSEKSDSPGLGSRLKSTFRDMFKRDPIDETAFERINSRHWADDD